jgi:ribosomal protein L11 methyltransferase
MHWSIEIEAPSEVSEWLSWLIASRLESAVEQLDQETLTPGASEALDTLIVRLERAPTEEQLATLRACLDEVGCPHAPLRTSADDDEGWRLGWRAFFKPVEVAPGVVARPPWEPRSEGQGEGGVIDIVIDPGLAFGVGTHPTTKLAASLLKAELEGREPCDVLDQGSGSGLLAMLAAHLGHRVRGVEIDEMATLSARDNLPLNGFSEEQVKLEVGEEVPEGPFEVVVANIIAPVLIALAPALSKACVGRLILSGMLTTQEAEVRAAYPEWRVCERVVDEESGWVGLRLERASEERASEERASEEPQA